MRDPPQRSPTEQTTVTPAQDTDAGSDARNEYPGPGLRTRSARVDPCPTRLPLPQPVRSHTAERKRVRPASSRPGSPADASGDAAALSTASEVGRSGGESPGKVLRIPFRNDHEKQVWETARSLGFRLPGQSGYRGHPDYQARPGTDALLTAIARIESLDDSPPGRLPVADPPAGTRAVALGRRSHTLAPETTAQPERWVGPPEAGQYGRLTHIPRMKAELLVVEILGRVS